MLSKIENYVRLGLTTGTAHCIYNYKIIQLLIYVGQDQLSNDFLLIVGGNLAAKWPSLLFPQGPFFIHLIKTIQTISTCVFHIILIFW